MHWVVNTDYKLFVCLCSDEYSVDIKYSDEPGSVSLSRDSNIKFFGPLSPSLADSIDQLPVQYVRPYFDCGRSNKWIFSSSAPIYDRLPRYVYDPSIPGNRSAGIFDNLRTNRYCYHAIITYVGIKDLPIVLTTCLRLQTCRCCRR